VIDASGTWTQPNPMGASGLPALGETDAGARIVYGLLDVLGRDRDRYAGRRTVVVGAGHLAATSLLALAELQEQAHGTEVVWAVRSATPRPLVGKGSAETDELPARGRLATDLAALVDAGQIQLVTGFRIHTVEPVGDRMRLVGDQYLGDDLDPAHRLAVEADEVIAEPCPPTAWPSSPGYQEVRSVVAALAGDHASATHRDQDHRPRPCAP